MAMEGNGHGGDKRDSTVDARTLYIEQLRKEASVFPKMPDVEVKFDFSYKLLLPNTAVNREIETVGKAFLGCFSSPFTIAKAVYEKASGQEDSSVTEFYVLKECKGVVHPGTMTLLLSTPGGGKTSFLKALAGRIPLSKLSGHISYNGASQQDLTQEGIKLRLLSNYVDQLDVHLPYLTVRETAEFACFNSTVDPEMMGHEMLIREAQHRVDRVLKLLSLTNCANTLVGNELVRGVSGGEKKRVTIAEALVSNARLLCLDEISTGLDASVTFDICASIRVWAKEMRGTVIIALLQPTPEVYHQFDDVILLREGQVMFQGGKHVVHRYLADFGFIPPKSTMHAMEDDDPDAEEGDVADWLTEVLASPQGVWMNQKKRRAMSKGKLSSPSLQDMSKVESQTNLAKKPPLTTAEFVSRWLESKLFSERFDAPPSVPRLALESDFAKAQYGRQYPRNFAAHFASILRRQVTITLRNSLFVSSRLISACIISAILGSVWFQLDESQGFAKFGMLLFAALQVAFSNLSETPFAVEFKYVAYKQMAAGMYPPAAYVAAGSVVHVPIAAIETAFFSVVLFFMVGLQPGEGRDTPGGRWAFFYLILFLVDLCMGAVFRGFAYILPNMEAAQTAPGPFIALQVIFAGFLISPNHMGWLLFMYFISIFGYTLKSIAQNEFSAPIYTKLVPNDPVQIQSAFTHLFMKNISFDPKNTGLLCNSTYMRSPAVGYTGGISCVQYGESIMRYLVISTNPGWKWGGVGFLIGFALITNLVSTIGLTTVHIERNIGTSRGDEEKEEKEGGDNDEEVVWIDNKEATSASVMPFTPMTIVWRDIEYTVNLNKNLGGGSKVLLQSLSGVAVPGKLMALMGASGAGKTTLLDVIAGRKSSGTMKGRILLNGFDKEAKSFARLTAYCEQLDVHNSFSTVQESLKFSAALRLPPTVSDSQRSAFVNEVMDLLELRSIAGRKVGEVGSAEGLSPGQRKILTIAVEMVSNAPILFLDEPTSGLDSRSAQIVMREVRKIANTGRTVICTIHQPSKELFFKFDEMCLLQRGGWQAYFGPVGARACDLIAYVEGIPGAHPCPAGMNPASWMLDVLAGTDSSGGNERPKEHMNKIETRAVLDAVNAANGPPAEAQAASMLPGPMLQETYQSSAAWANVLQAIEHHSSPPAGAQPYKFDSVYARSLLYQLYQCSRRVQRSHWRNTGLNFVRIAIIWGLMIMFGTIYYKIADANDAAGVQSIVSVVFMTTFFIAIINMNTAIPVLIRERAVFYRERFSNMYPPEVHAIAFAVGEIPWLTLEICIVIPCLYFMLGFRADAATFFTYLLVNWIMSYLFVSLGQLGAAYFPTADVAQAVLGVFIPLFFLFGGLYLPYPSIPIYWKWAYWADPISYCIEALIPTQFMRQGNCQPLATKSTPLSNVTNYCPYMVALGDTGFYNIDRYEYVKETYGLKEEFRWPAVGYLAVFCGGLQCLHALAVRFKSHINR